MRDAVADRSAAGPGRRVADGKRTAGTTSADGVVAGPRLQKIGAARRRATTKGGRRVPSWVVLLIAAAVVVAGAVVAAALRSRGQLAAQLDPRLTALRARIESLRYTIDAAASAGTAEAARLVDAAEASLASASRFRSVAACRAAEKMLGEAEAELSGSSGRAEPSDHDRG